MRDVFARVSKQRRYKMSVSEKLGSVKSIELENGRIDYRESGAGRPIVFVHGFLVNGDLWRKVAPQLSGDFRCIVPDWPMGSHKSPMRADTDLSPRGMAAIVAEFLEAMELDDVVLVGNDSGGAICQVVVTEHPERVGALVLTPCDSFEKFPPAPFSMLPKILKVPGLAWLSWQSMRMKFGRRIGFGPLMKSGYDDSIVRDSWIRPGLKDAAIRRDGRKFGSGMDPQVTIAAAKKLESLQIPALMAWPPHCTFFTFDLAERLAAAIPNSQITEIPDALTFLSEDQPEALAVAINEFAIA